MAVNVRDRRLTAKIRGVMVARFAWFDAIVILHSVFSNGCYLGGWLYDAVARAPQPKAYFIGNEYKLMPEKMRFCEELGVSLLVSQTDSPAVHALYQARLGCKVTWIPHSGLDPDLFKPCRLWSEREIDIGYRAAEASLYLGHDERRQIAHYFLAHGHRWNLRVDVSLKPEDRLAGSDWAEFLNRCKGQMGTEAGGDFFELTDDTRRRVNAYVREHPDAGIEEIYPRFFEDYSKPVPIRIISGRNVEAAGTKTVQILFEGHYGGYFQPDVHYIPLKKDFSNIDDVIAKFRDAEHCRRLVENAYRVALSELTYDRLIDRFHTALSELL